MLENVNKTQLKKDYLNGIKPSALAKNYDINLNALYQWISDEKLPQKKSKYSEKIELQIENELTELTNDSFRELKRMLNNPELNDAIKTKAISLVWDANGIKKQTIDNNNKNEFINHIMLDD